MTVSNKYMDALRPEAPASDYKDGINDKWTFEKDSKGEWRWTRRARNGEITGASHEGFKNLKDCENNARRPAWNGVSGKVSPGIAAPVPPPKK